MAKFDLLTTLSLNAAGFTSGIDRAKQSTQGFQSAIKGIAGFLAPVVSVGAALGIMKAAMNSTDITAENLEVKMATLKGTTDGLLRTIATGNWETLASNMRLAAEATRDVVRAQGELDDQLAGNTITKGRLERGLEAAKLDAAGATTPEGKQQALATAKDFQERLTAINVGEIRDRLKIDEDYYKKLSNYSEGYYNYLLGEIPKIAQNTKYWFGNDEANLEGLKAVVAQLTSEQQLLGSYMSKEHQEQLRTSKLAVMALEDFKMLRDEMSAPDQFNNYIKGLGELQSAIADGDQALIKLEKQLTTVDTKLQTRTIVKGNSKVSTGNLSIPTFYNGGDQTPNDLAKMNTEAAQAVIEKNKATQAAIEWNLELNAVLERQQEIFDSMADTLLQGADNFKDYAKVVKNSIREAISAMIAEGIASMILSGLKTAGLSGPGALFLAPALAAMGGGLARTAFNSMIPAFAGGGVSMGGMAVVGERGAELVNLPAGSRVFNNTQSRGMLGGEVVFRIEGNALVGVLNNHNRRSQSFA